MKKTKSIGKKLKTTVESKVKKKVIEKLSPFEEELKKKISKKIEEKKYSGIKGATRLAVEFKVPISLIVKLGLDELSRTTAKRRALVKRIEIEKKIKWIEKNKEKIKGTDIEKIAEKLGINPFALYLNISKKTRKELGWKVPIRIGKKIRQTSERLTDLSEKIILKNLPKERMDYSSFRQYAEKLLNEKMKKKGLEQQWRLYDVGVLKQLFPRIEEKLMKKRIMKE